jgi:hypothetical protein
MTANAHISVCLTTKTRLEKALKKAGINDPTTVSRLTVKGTILLPDFRYISDNMAETLQALDFSQAIVEENEIMMQAFIDCTALTSVIVPETLTRIDIEAFFNCSSLTSIVIPDSVVQIGERAFSACNSLTTINIPNLITEINESVFSDCTDLTSITIPDSVKRIGRYAFFRCSGLTSLAFPNSLVEISENAFYECTGLKSVFIPASVLSIDENAFYKCPAIITVHPDNPAYTSQNGKLKFKEMKGVSGRAGKLHWMFGDGVLTFYGNGEIPDYDDYQKHTEVGNHTEKGRSPWYPFRQQIKKIVFNGAISKKGVYTFTGCDNLTSVIFENNALNGIIDYAMQGYTLSDLWNIDSWFCGHIPRMIQEFKRKTICHPGNMTYQEWGEILDRISFCFSEIEQLLFTHDEEKADYLENMKNEGFELLKKHFWHLWW